MGMSLEDFKKNYITAADKQMIDDKHKVMIDRLEEMNDMLFQEFKKLNSVSTERPHETQTEINKCNAMSNVGKVILQATAAQIAIEKQTS